MHEPSQTTAQRHLTLPHLFNTRRSGSENNKPEKLDCPLGQNKVAVVERWTLVEVRLKNRNIFVHGHRYFPKLARTI